VGAVQAARLRPSESLVARGLEYLLSTPEPIRNDKLVVSSSRENSNQRLKSPLISRIEAETNSHFYFHEAEQLPQWLLSRFGFSGLACHAATTALYSRSRVLDTEISPWRTKRS
jgi:hypothetical protein